MLKSTLNDEKGTDVKTRILLLINNPADRKIIQQQLPDSIEYIDSPESLSDEEFDLCMVDYDSFRQHRKELSEIKRHVAPQFLPYLMVAEDEFPMRQNGMVWDIIDDLVQMPVIGKHLNVRVDNLLRCRHMSLELKRKSDSLDLFKQAINSTNAGVLITDARQEDNPIIFCNNGFSALTGYLEEEILGRNCRFLQEDDNSQMGIDQIRSLIDRGEKGKMRLRNYRRDGSMFWNELKVAPIKDSKGEVTHFVGIQNDVTEHVQTETQLRESQELWEKLTMQNPLLVMITIDGELRFINHAGVSIVGAKNPEELIGRSVYEIVELNKVEELKRRQKSIHRGESTDPMEIKITTLEGEERFLEIQSLPITYNNQKGIQTIAQDITERRNYERQLKEEKEFLDKTVESLPGMFFMFDEDLNFVKWNDNVVKILGFNSNEIKKMHPLDFFEEKNQPLVSSKIAEVFREGEASVEVDVRSKSGRLVPHFLIAKTAIREGKSYIVGTGVDIAERKEMEEKLRFQAHTLDAIGEAVITTDPDGRIIYWNHAAEKLYGWKSEEVIGNNILDVTPPLRSEEHATEIWEALNRNERWSGEFTLRRKDGSTFPAIVTDSPVLNEDGEIIAIIGISTDITERVEAEKQLKESEKRWEQLVQKNPGLVQIIADDKIEFINPAGAKIYGATSPDEVIGKQWSQFTLGEEEPAIRGKIKTALKGKVIPPEVYKAWTVDNEERYVELQSVPVRYQGKDALMTVGQEVTDRIQYERRLKKTNEQLETAQGIAKLGYWTHDIPENCSDWSDQMYKIWGVKPDTFTPKLESFFKSVHPDDKELFVTPPDKRFPDQSYQDFEHRIITPDGTVKWILDRIRVIRDYRGQPKMMEGIAQDITDQKKKEQELNKTYEQLEQAQKIAEIGYWTHDIPENRSIWSDRMYKIWEVERERFTPNFENMLETVHPEDRRLIMNDPEDAFPDQDYHDTEHRIITPDGKTKWILERITLHRDNRGRPKMMEGIAQDITEQKKKEKVIREALKEKEILLAEVHHRVKNNLAVISGLLELQEYNAGSDELKGMLSASKMRIKTMALIHEKLYQSHSLTKIDFGSYIEGLVKSISEISDPGKNIRIEPNCASFDLNINQAVPCALILNEMISNAYKHAFKDRSLGVIKILLKKENDMITVTVKDNGTGLPEKKLSGKNRSMGFTIIETLIQQLHSELKIENKKGTTLSFSFEKQAIKGSSSTLV